MLKEELSEKLFAKQTILVESEMVGMLLDRSVFQKLIFSDLQQFNSLLDSLLKKVNINPENIDEVILTGGCSLVPAVKKHIKDIFPNVKKWFEKDALWANVFGSVRHNNAINTPQLPVGYPENKHPNLGILNFNAHSKDLEVDVIVSASAVLPLRVRRNYYTNVKDQREINLTIVQFVNSPTDYQIVERLIIGPLLGSEAQQVIEVTFLYDEEGTLRITSYDPETGTEYQNVLQIASLEGFQFHSQRQLVRETAVNGVL
jgi:molecular chaperone DnaK (HSP70)